MPTDFCSFHKLFMFFFSCSPQLDPPEFRIASDLLLKEPPKVPDVEIEKKPKVELTAKNDSAKPKPAPKPEPKTEQKPVQEKGNPKVLIMTNHRSGSSFTGELFNQLGFEIKKVKASHYGRPRIIFVIGRVFLYKWKIFEP